MILLLIVLRKVQLQVSNNYFILIMKTRFTHQQQ